MKLYKGTLKINGAVVYTGETPWPYQIIDEARNKMSAQLFNQPLHTLAEGELADGSLNIAVEWECVCLVNRRGKRRAPQVIAAEKAAKRVKQLARAEENRKREEEAARIRKAKRVRITQQIDHAFQTGHESGSEPVAKYITCDTCSSPADFLYVNTPLAPGAAVLDEGTITDAVCAQHNMATNQWQRQYYYKHVAEIIPCARLEFFYTGIRQIAIKSERA